MFSYWESGVELQQPDFAFIGAGIVGLNAAIALKLKLPSADICIFERGMLPNGASTKNAGFACFGSAGEILVDISDMGVDKSLDLVEKRLKGLELLRKNLGDPGIDFKPCGSFELFRNTSSFKKVADQLEYLNKLMQKLGLSKTFQLDRGKSLMPNKHFPHAIFSQYEGSINPMRMMQSLLSKARNLGIRIYFGAELKAYQKHGLGYQLSFPENKVLNCRNLIFCTNGFSENFFPELLIKPARAQVLVTKPIPGLKLKSTYHFDEGFFYFREIDGRILLGGGRNLDLEKEESQELKLNSKIQESLDQMLAQICSEKIEIEQRWTGIMGIGPDKTYKLQENTDGSFIAAGLGGMGIAIGSLVGKELADLIQA